MSNCARCEALPEPLPESGTLYLSPPLTHTGTTLRRVLEEHGLDVSAAGPNMLRVSLAPGCLPKLLDSLFEALGAAERRDIRALLLAEGHAPTFEDLGRVQKLETLIARARGLWLHAMIRDDRLLTHFQPIVRAEAPDEVFAHECLLRGVRDDGSMVPPGVLYDAARAADLMFPLDRAARLRAIRGAVENGLNGRIFINFNPTSVYDPVYCLRTTVRAVEDAGIDPSDVIFEVVESDESHPDLARITDFYRKSGFRVALDDLGAGFGSLNLMSALRPDFVKLDMALIRDIDRDPYKAEVVGHLLTMARSLGITTVAEGIETEGEFDCVRGLGADLAQGYLFARPDCPPPIPRRLAVPAGSL